MNKIEQRLKRWAVRGRSLYGRITIIRTMIQSITLYKASSLQIHKPELKKLQSTFRRFINKTMDRDQPFISTRKMSALNEKWIYLESKKGGLGLTPLQATIETMQIKSMLKLIQVIEDDRGITPTHLRPIIAIWKATRNQYTTKLSDLLLIPTRGHLMDDLKRQLPIWWYNSFKLSMTKSIERIVDISNPIWENRNIVIKSKTIGGRLWNISSIHPREIKRIMECGLNHLKDYIDRNRRWLNPRQLVQKAKSSDPKAEELLPAFSFIHHHLRQSLAQSPITQATQAKWILKVQDQPIPIGQADSTSIRSTIHNPKPPEKPRSNHARFNYEDYDANTWNLMQKIKKFTLPMVYDVRWRVMHNSMITGSRFKYLENPTNSIDPNCVHGCGHIESIWHLFWSCPKAKKIWSNYITLWQTLNTDTLSWKHILDPSKPTFDKIEKAMRIDMSTVFGIVSSIILHKIWYNRNSIMFEHPEANETEEQIINQINYRIQLHWLTMFRLSKPKSKKRLRRIYRVLTRHPQGTSILGEYP